MLLGMSVIDEVLAANEVYSRTHELRRLTPRPERKLAVLTCMDTRYRFDAGAERRRCRTAYFLQCGRHRDGGTVCGRTESVGTALFCVGIR